MRILLPKIMHHIISNPMKSHQEILVECWYGKIGAVWLMLMHYKRE